MKPTQVTELFATIRRTFVSFFSVMMFVALGVGIFTGITWSGDALQKAASQMTNEGNLHHFQIQYPYGLVETDLDELRSVDGVTDVEAGRQAVRTLEVNGKDRTVKVQTLPERIDVPIVVEGTLPQADDEIALKATSANAYGIQVGDVIEFNPATAQELGVDPATVDGISDTDGQMTRSSFTVTALVESPEYFARYTPVFGYTLTGSTSVNIVAWALPGAFDNAAFAGGYPVVNIRCDSLNAFDTYSGTYQEESREIEGRIVEAGKPLSTQRYQSLRETANTALDAGSAYLEDLRATVAAHEGQADDTIITVGGVEMTLGEARQQDAEGDGTLAQAQGRVESAEDIDWVVSSRAYNGSIMEAQTLSNVTGSLSLSMALLFVIVGLLVSYSAMGRIVREQVVEIGTKKALGLREREITTSFLAYAGLAVILGAIIGLVIAVVLVERIIGSALSDRFLLGLYPPSFDIGLALGVTAVELVLVLGATWLACRSVLKRQATELLKGDKPPTGKPRFFEKWELWSKLPLYTQTIVNNCLNDKRRMFSTIVGVAGCTALIVTAVTLSKDVLRSFDKQYENVYGYTAIVWVDTSVEGAATELASALEEQGCTVAPVMRAMEFIHLPDGGKAYGYVVVPEDQTSFSAIYHINPKKAPDGAAVDSGVWVTQAYASHMGAAPGDEIVFSSIDGSEYRTAITGFYEFYIAHFEIVMDRATYEEVFGQAYVPNAILVDTGGQKTSDIAAAVSSVPGYDGITNHYQEQKWSFDSFAEVSHTVVLVYLLLAVLMAIVVLLNLNVMFINEKKRELTVLMINGFSLKQAKRYVYNDTIALTVVGIVCGLVLGVIMGAVTVTSVETDAATFFKGISWMAVLAGAAVSAVLSFIMCAIALKRIDRFKLTDINKA